MKYTDEELIEAIKKEYDDTGIIPKSTNKNRIIHLQQFNRRFGGWAKSLQMAGIPTQNPMPILRRKCQECNNEFNTNKSRNKIFCSIQCSNISRRNKNWKPRQKRTEWLETLRNKTFDHMMNTPFNELSWDIQRKRVKREQGNKCGRCDVNKWFELSIPLEIDHIDGNNMNDERSNLIALCPNCHSITPTWRSKNIACNKVTDEELKKALEEKDNIRQALISVGMAPKGGNYRRANKLLLGLGKYDRYHPLKNDPKS